jgi:hypothetical protein
MQQDLKKTEARVTLDRQLQILKYEISKHISISSLFPLFLKNKEAYEITLLSVFVCLCIPLSLLGNGSV